jgi:hypothetical protein
MLAVAVSVLLLVLGVPGWSETSSVPAPGSRDAYRPKGWSGGEHIVRVQRCGRDHVLLWVDLTHVLSNAKVTTRDAHGNPREVYVMLVASDAGMTAELPDNDWWREAVGMKRRRAPLVPIHRMPTAETSGRPGETEP